MSLVDGALVANMVWRLYLSDDGREYAVKMRDAYAADPARGFPFHAQVGDIQYPRGWRVRRVLGIGPAGQTLTADCGSPDADLWTGVVTVFTVIGTAGELVQGIVIGRQQERILNVVP